LRIFRIN